MKRLGLLLVILLLVAAAPQLAGAAGTHRQGAGPVSYDAPVEGQITNDAFTQTWTFEPISADRIEIKVERLDGNLIPSVNLVDASNNVLADSYGADQTQATALINVTLQAGGTFQINVTRANGQNGTTSGSYRLTVTPVALAPDNPNNTAVVGPVTYDAPVTGEITPVHWRNFYTLTAEEGDFIELTAERTSGTLYPEIHILDSTGSDLQAAYVSRTGEFADLIFTIPGAGDYTVVVTRDGGQNGDTLGAFQLSAILLGSGENSQRLTSIPPQSIDLYDTPVQGEITNAAWYQNWQFRTEAADIITITVTRSPDYTSDNPNNLIPYVALLGGAGQEISRGYADSTHTQATIYRYTMEGPGTYTVRVVRDGDKGGVTTGTYSLVVSLDGSGEGSPALAGTDGAVTPDTPVKGQISNTRWLNTWTFSGQQGQVVTITAERSGGTLVPHVDLLDMNGSSLFSAGPADTGDKATIVSYTLPTTGDYQIAVYREGNAGGFTSGTYSLTVTAAAAAQ